MAVALLLPRVLARGGDRAVMTRAAFVLPGALGLLALGLTLRPGTWSWPALLVVWLVVGAAGSAVLTPGGRVVRRCVRGTDLPAVFAARFSLSHVCWLLAYPLAGGLAATAGPAVSAAVLTVVALVGAVAATRLWPATEPESGEGPDVRTDPESGAGGAAGAGSRQRGSRISRPSRTTSRP